MARFSGASLQGVAQFHRGVRQWIPSYAGTVTSLFASTQTGYQQAERMQGGWKGKPVIRKPDTGLVFLSREFKPTGGTS